MKTFTAIGWKALLFLLAVFIVLIAIIVIVVKLVIFFLPLILILVLIFILYIFFKRSILVKMYKHSGKQKKQTRRKSFKKGKVIETKDYKVKK